jgi:glycosyltransferase involved in cell wall biosynthesis
MNDVMLIHDDKMQLPIYRVHIYRYLREFLKANNYNLTIIADGVFASAINPLDFPLYRMKLGLGTLIRLVRNHNPRVCILVVNHSKSYFFPFLIYLRIKNIKAITWTHGVNLQRKNSKLSEFAHYLEHELCNAIILYADHLKRYIAKSHRSKVFVANNTLNLTGFSPQEIDKKAILTKYGIYTQKNIIFVGRIQKRKRIYDLLAAFELLKDRRYGLVIVGPDEEGLIASLDRKNERVFLIGPLYGKDVLELLSSCDVFCIPGAIGLSIVDAMYCGLPVITERLDHGPEIMYLHEGGNGFVVEKGDCSALAGQLDLLLGNDQLRLQFSRRAKEEISARGHIDNLSKGVLRSLDHVIGTTVRR